MNLRSPASIRGVLECLLRIVADSSGYFVSGSLSFLPLLGGYREPVHDVDASIEQRLFRLRRDRIEREGRLRVLRLHEVAVAESSPLARVFAPRTDFAHLETPAGLLDLTVYRARRGFLVFGLGAGLSLALPESVLARVRILAWEGLEYRAGPPELAFLPKLVWYARHRGSFAAAGADERKHLLDLRSLAPLVDWRFAAALLAQGRVRWFGRDLPFAIERRLNPFRALDLERLRRELTQRAG